MIPFSEPRVIDYASIWGRSSFLALEKMFMTFGMLRQLTGFKVLTNSSGFIPGCLFIFGLVWHRDMPSSLQDAVVSLTVPFNDQG